jgi:hypothetical protein
MRAFVFLFLISFSGGLWAARCVEQLTNSNPIRFDNGSDVVLHIQPQGIAKLNKILNQKLRTHFDNSNAHKLDLENLSTEVADFLRRDLLKSYLSGFNPTIQLGSLEYQVSLEEVKVAASQKLAEKYGLQDQAKKGLILEVELGLQSAAVRSSGAQIDVVAPGVGRFGYDNLEIKSLGPIKIHIPVFLAMKEGSGFEVQVLSLDGFSVSEIGFELDGLKVPQVELVIDGQKTTLLQNAELFENFRHQTSDLLTHNDKVKALIPQVLRFLNQGFAQVLTRLEKSQRLSHTLDLSPLIEQMASFIGSEAQKSLNLLIEPRQLRMSENQGVILGAKLSLSSSEKMETREGKQACEISCKPHDLAIAVNKDFMQETVNELWSKGFFNRMIVSPGRAVTLIEPPKIQALTSSKSGNNQEVKISFHARPETNSGLNFFAKENFSVRLNATLSLSHSSDGKLLKIDLINVDTEGVIFNESDLKLPFRLAAKMTPGFVKEAIQSLILNQLSSIMTDGRLSQNVPLSSLGTLTDLLGPLKMTGIGFDRFGHLNVLIDLSSP